MISAKNRTVSEKVNYLIIGNSASGIAAIEAIRECDKKGRITVISDEKYYNYSRPLISYLLAKKINPKDISYKGKEFYRKNDVDLILNKKATALDTKKKLVILKGDKRIKFDKLLLATGGAPFAPKIKGVNLEGVFSFTKLSDAENIEKYIKTNKVKEAVVIGGGLIGLKATEALLTLKMKINIIELADRILSATFDKKASGMMSASLRKAGCNLVTENTVDEIVSAKDFKVKGVLLKDKKRIDCGMVIIAVGVIPNIELVEKSPIKINRGILVDDFMRTNIKDIYASGDCCEGKDLLLGINRSIAIWPVAVRQGKIAGYNMASGLQYINDWESKRKYQGGLAMNSVELCGIPTISIGQTKGDTKECQVLEYYDKNKYVYKKIVLKDNKIIGAIFLGDIERAGIYTGLIKDKIDVSSFKESLLKEDFGLINLPREYRKHLVKGEIALI